VEEHRLNTVQISKHFNLKEFECPCCHRVKLSPDLVKLLEKIRKKIGKPIVISSGYRCPFHNEAVGGKPHSYHLLGMAADIVVPHFSPVELGRVAFEAGAPTVIVYPSRGFVHIDIREKGLGLVGG